MKSSGVKCTVSLLLIALLLLFIGCSGTNSSKDPNPQPGTTALKVNFARGICSDVIDTDSTIALAFVGVDDRNRLEPSVPYSAPIFVDGTRLGHLSGQISWCWIAILPQT